MPTDTRAGFTFFWRPDSPFSQWHPSTFVVDGVAFACAEQFMMHGKARLFDDAEVAAEILATPDPRAHKALGRKVRGFDDRRWKAAREDIVYAGSRAKFTQNPALRAALLATVGTRLVEASPMDRIWGIGLSMHDSARFNPSQWRGRNLLGYALMLTRKKLNRVDER